VSIVPVEATNALVITGSRSQYEEIMSILKKLDIFRAQVLVEAVIIEAGRVADYPTLEAFKTAVLGNPPELYKTVVPGDHILVYSGCGATAKEIVQHSTIHDTRQILARRVFERLARG